MSSDIAISVKNISKCYLMYDRPQDRLKQSIFRHRRYFREFWALKDVSFEVKKGETVGIIGRNGSGKSTLLQIIAGTLTPTSGEVQVKGRVAALLELGSGFNPEFTGRDNVYMNGMVLGLNREEMDKKFNEIEEYAGIGNFIEQPVKTYSSGMIVRLAFAVAVCVEPEILIVDEALAVGDAAFQQKCLNHIETMITRGITILMVSHDTQIVKNYCKSGIYLENGQIKNIGDAEKTTEVYLKDVWASVNKPSGGEETITWKDSINSQGGVAFGSKSGEIFEAKLFINDNEGNVALQDDKITLLIRARVDRSIINPKIIWQIRDIRGYTIYGMETNSNGINFPKSERDEGLIGASFSFTARLAPGQYFFSVGLTDHINDESNVLLDKQVGILDLVIMKKYTKFIGICNLDGECSKLNL